MATIYSEDWAAGDSVFGSVYRYNTVGVDSDPPDPLYPFVYVAEGVYVNGDGRLDKNPAYTGEFQTYQQAGIHFKGIGPLSTTNGSGYWNAHTGCIQAVYYPTEESLALDGDGAIFDAPLLALATPEGFPMLGVSVQLVDTQLSVQHQNDGSHPDTFVGVTGAPMPVAGEPYTVRMQWVCGTMDLVEETIAEDGNVKIWINDELVYEAVNISLLLEYPYTYLVDPPNMLDSIQFGYFGLLGPLDSIFLSDSACVITPPVVFRSGTTSSPLIWMKLLLKGSP